MSNQNLARNGLGTLSYFLKKISLFQDTGTTLVRVVNIIYVSFCTSIAENLIYPLRNKVKYI